METTETFYIVPLSEANIERVIAALRTQAKIALDQYTTELLNQGPTPYVGLLEEAYDDLIGLANTFELVLPE
jgi:hypothetical protein